MTKSQRHNKFLVLIVWTFVGLFITNMAYGQSKSVSGTVKDKTGLTLPGVNIVVKGSTTGTTTNTQGEYNITTEKPSDILVFTMIGMDTTEMAVGNQSIIDIVMTEDLVALDEVVVTAMGISRKKNSLGYAVQSIKGEEITMGGNVTTIGSLSGKIAGVQVTSATQGIDGTPRVVIRGINSLSTDNQPLFIVDGIPISTNQAEGIGSYNFSVVGQVNDFGSPLSDINPNDIESVNVLKGASAAALYGSRASNGVILITTKRADKNATGIGVSINSTTTWQNPLYTPAYQNEFGWGSNGIFDDPTMSGNCWGPRLDTGEEYVQYDSPIDPATGEQIATPWVSHKDNYKNYFETGLTLSNNVAINASGEKVRARLSYTNVNQTDMIPNVSMKKNILNFNSNMDLTKKFSIDFFMNYSNTDSPNRTAGSGEGIMSGLLYMPSNVDVQELTNHLDAGGNMRSFVPKEINPYYVIRENTFPVKREHFNGKISLNYQILDWMKIRAGVSRDQTLSLQKRMVNINYIPDYWGNTDGEFTDYHFFIVESNADFLLEIDRRLEFNEDFRYTFNFGGNLLDIKHQNTSAGTQGGLVNYSEYNLNNSRLSPWGDTYSSQKRMNSLFGQLILSYKTFAYLDFTGRNDWSSTLPKESRSYFYPSISGTLIFSDLFKIDPNILSFGKIRANWAKVGSDTSPYSLMRYAQRSTNWTDGIMPYYYTNPIPPVALKPEFNTQLELGLVLNFLNNRLNLDLAVYDAEIENQILEIPTDPSRGFTSELVNIGVMNNRGIEAILEAVPIRKENFSWSLRVNWAKNNTDLLNYIDRSPYYEITSFAGAQILAPNRSYYDQLQKDIDNGVVKGSELSYLDKYLKDHGRYGDIFGTYYLRDDNGDIMTDDGYPIHSGQADHQEYFTDPETGEIYEDKFLDANTQPDFLLGFNNQFTYKQFSLSFLWDCLWGGTFVSHHYLERIKNGMDPITVGTNDKGNSIRDDVVMNDDGTYASNTGGIRIQGTDVNTGQPNEIYVDAETYFYDRRDFPTEANLISGTYIKLRELAFTYNIPSAVCSKIKIQRASISLIGNNLLLFHGFQDVPDYFGISTDAKIKAPFDPESSMGYSNSGVGVEYGALPSARSLGFNISVTF